MKKRMKRTLPLVLAILASCTSADKYQQGEAGQVKDEFYHCAEIGWTMRIPAGWEVLSSDEKEAINDKGFDAISQQAKFTIDSLKNLIAFKKDPFNSFLSTIERAEEEYPGQYAENCKALNALLYDTFVAQGVQVDTASGMEHIQGKGFYLLSTRVHGPDGKVILEQRSYSRLVNGYDHGVTLSYNNNADRDTLESVWRASAFAM